MNDHTIGLVRESFDLVEPMASEVGALFYANLFRIDPALKPLFKSDLRLQGDRLVHMIATAVGLLDRPELLTPALTALGQRHGLYGVVDAHYDTVGTALLHTLAQGLGPAFTDEVREAWVEVYGVMAGTMKNAARVTA